MRDVRVAVIGFGSVGRSLARILALKAGKIERAGVRVSVVGVADSSGMVISEGGLPPIELLKLAEAPRSSLGWVSGMSRPYVDLREMYDRAQPDVHVELTPANYETGEPGYANIKFALARGAHVVTANKSPLVLDYRGLTQLAESKGLSLEFTATVMGGTPFLRALRHLRSHEILRVEGLLNTTSNFVLSLMHEKLVGLDEAIREAQALGVAERDPGLDIDGVDAAAKLVIISHVVGKPVALRDVRRESLRGLSVKDVASALREGAALKQVALLDFAGGSAEVRLRRVGPGDPLHSVSGLMNAARVETDVGWYFFVGRGGGGMETAHTVLNDLLEIALRGGARWRA